MKPQLTSTHIQILKLAASQDGWTEFSLSDFNANHLETNACCQELERLGLIEFEDGGTELGTNHKPPVFTQATNNPKMAITANGIRALEEHSQ